MATLKTGNKKGSYRDIDSKLDVISYILNPEKAQHSYIGGMSGTPRNIAENMNDVSVYFGKERGVQLRHYIISFSPNEINDPALVNIIAQRIIEYFAEEYQVIYAVHEDKPHLHIHIVINSVSFVDGHRYYGKREEFNAFRNFIKNLLRQYGIYCFYYVSNSDK